MENPIKMDDLGVPLFLETPIYDLYYLEQIVSWTVKLLEVVSQLLRSEAVSQNKLQNWDSKTVLWMFSGPP